MSYTASVITISDLGSRGLRQDTSGPAVRAMLEDAGFTVVHTAIVPDERGQISALLRACADEKRIDLIPDHRRHGAFPTRRHAGGDRRRAGAGDPRHSCGHVGGGAEDHAKRHALPRRAGTRGSSLIVNLPGSEKAARENLAAVLGALEHALHMIAAEGHG